MQCTTTCTEQGNYSYISHFMIRSNNFFPYEECLHFELHIYPTQNTFQGTRFLVHKPMSNNLNLIFIWFVLPLFLDSLIFHGYTSHARMPEHSFSNSANGIIRIHIYYSFLNQITFSFPWCVYWSSQDMTTRISTMLLLLGSLP